jgi:hypothetical protein
VFFLHHRAAVARDSGYAVSPFPNREPAIDTDDSHFPHQRLAKTAKTSCACLSVDALVSSQINFPSLNR